MTESAGKIPSPQIAARRWSLGGRVQGVGLRPFVRDSALRLGLSGRVRNRSGIVEVLAQGDPGALARFESCLLTAAPFPAAPRLVTSLDTAPQALDGFVIEDSSHQPAAGGAVIPDQGLCDDCRAEIDDPGQRRHRYAFTHCVRCGPRYSIITALPFDRANTTLAAFPPCPQCAAEYRDPGDRRCHAQTLVCPDCGPRLALRDARGVTAQGAAALDLAVIRLRDGAIVAVKGIGGYHLLCDAANRASVERLRRDKPRPDKPFAVMFPHGDSQPALADCVALDTLHREALADPACPILLAPLQPHCPLPDNLAPGLNELGIMLPYSPLHHLLLADFGGPLVATSANPRGEPVLIDGPAVESRLAGVAEAFLHHDREIRRPAEDPVRRVIAGRVRCLRPGRGDAPIELPLPFELTEPWLAVGGHLKNTVALACGDRVLVSPEIGALDSPRGRALFAATIEDLQALHGVRVRRVACDAHPAYASRRWALASGLAVTEVLHHEAHAAIVAGEAARPGPWLVFTWDGIGLGADGALWGGEALLGDIGTWRRVAGFRPLRIPGGEQAGRAPWRSALALCLAAGQAWADCPGDVAMITHAWRRDLNCVTTGSVGRLFDAAAALVAHEYATTYEGQGPMRLEALAASVPADGQAARSTVLPLRTHADGRLETDWGPLVARLCDDAVAPAQRARAFHATLAHALLAQARALRSRHGPFTVGLSGGVFQNRLLTEHAIALLEADGFTVHLPATVPYNDAGLSYGQILEAATRCPR